MIKIESNLLSIFYDENKKQFVFTDKRIGKEWKQATIAGFNPSTPVAEGNKISYTISNEGVLYNVALTLENDVEVLYSVNADENSPLELLNFPTAIVTPDEDHYVLQTDAEGTLLSATDKHYPLEHQPVFSAYGGPIMAWIGMVDSGFNSGYMIVFETPFDTDVSLEKVDGLLTFSSVLKGSKETFGYERKQRYVFFDKGGYVAQCKYYRKYAWELNDVKTLKEKVKRFPAMDKMVGSVHMYLWDQARKDEFLKEMKDCGIDKALVLWDPNHLPYPSDTFSDTAKELGYGIGTYNLFTDIHEDTPENLAEKKRIPLLLNVYEGQFEYLTAKPKGGSTYSNVYGNYICPAAIRPEITKRLTEMQEKYKFETHFFDVYLANGLYECYDERHPVTREGYAKNIIENHKLAEDDFGVYLGGETGADFAGSHYSFAHGLMTLHRTWYTEPKKAEHNTIYGLGWWDDNENPQPMVGVRVAAPSFHRYMLNEKIRVPLYELVHHDAVVTSWRWEDGNHHCIDVWWKKDLLNVLYGNAPLWSINKRRFEEFKNTFIESYNKVIPAIQAVRYDEMLEHCFVTEDRLVQKTTWSSGKEIVVNFGDEDYNYNGTVISARDYIIA